jgi:hypothetical protein
LASSGTRFLDTGELLVGDKVEIDLDIQAVKAAAVEAA